MDPAPIKVVLFAFARRPPTTNGYSRFTVPRGTPSEMPGCLWHNHRSSKNVERKSEPVRPAGPEEQRNG